MVFVSVRAVADPERIDGTLGVICGRSTKHNFSRMRSKSDLNSLNDSVINVPWCSCLITWSDDRTAITTFCFIYSFRHLGQKRSLKKQTFFKVSLMSNIFFKFYLLWIIVSFVFVASWWVWCLSYTAFLFHLSSEVFWIFYTTQKQILNKLHTISHICTP